MKRQILGAAGAGLASLVFAATVAAADPTPSPSAAPTQASDTVPAVLGLSQAQVQALRHDGLSLAEIAAKQEVDPQRLVDALATRWTSRIDARVANGALTAAEAITLKAQVQMQATSMVNKVTLGGMQGAAVGARRAGPPPRRAPAGARARPRGPRRRRRPAGPRGRRIRGRDGSRPAGHRNRDLRRNRPARRRPAVGVRDARDGRIGDGPAVLPCWDDAAHPRRRR